MEYYKCLYTKHLVKKRKTWEDGFIVLKAGLAVLHDVDGHQLQEGVRLPSSALFSDDGPLKSFAGLLVTVEEKCGVQDLPSGLSDARKQSGVVACNSGSSDALKATVRTAESGFIGAAPAQGNVVPVLGRRTCQHFMPPKPIAAKAGDKSTDASNVKGLQADLKTGKPQQRSHGARQLQIGHAQEHAIDRQAYQNSNEGCFLNDPKTHHANNLSKDQRQQKPCFPDDTLWGPLGRSTWSSSTFHGADSSAGANRGAVAHPITATATVQVPRGVSAFQENRSAMRTDDDILALIGLGPDSPPKQANAVQHQSTAGTNLGNHHMGFNESQDRGGGSCAGVFRPDVPLQQRLNARAPVLKDSHSSGSGLWSSRSRQPQPDRPQAPEALADLNWDSTGLDDPWDGANTCSLAAGSGHGGCAPVPSKPNPLHSSNNWGPIAVGGWANPHSTATASAAATRGWASGDLTAGIASSIATVTEPDVNNAMGPAAACPPSPIQGAQSRAPDLGLARRRWGLDAPIEPSSNGAGDAAGGDGRIPDSGISSSGVGGPHYRRPGGHGGSLGLPGWELHGLEPAGVEPSSALIDWPSRPVDAGSAARNEWGLFVEDGPSVLSIEGEQHETDAAAGSLLSTRQRTIASSPERSSEDYCMRTVAAAASATAVVPAATAASPPSRPWGSAGADAGTDATVLDCVQQPGGGVSGGVVRSASTTVSACAKDNDTNPTTLAGRMTAARARWSAPTPAASLSGRPPAVGSDASPNPCQAEVPALAAVQGWAAAIARPPPQPGTLGQQGVPPRPPTSAADGRGHATSDARPDGADGKSGFGALTLPPLDRPGIMQRLVAIPSRFAGSEQYRSTLMSAMTEEINLRLCESVQPLYGIVRCLLTSTTPMAVGGGRQGGGMQSKQVAFGQQGVGVTAPRVQRPAGNATAAAAATDSFSRLPPAAQAAEIERACQPVHVPYFASCTLTCWVNREWAGGGGGGKKNRKRGGGVAVEEDEENGDAAAACCASKVSYYLIIPSSRSRLKNFRRHDLWIISSNPLLQGSGMGSGGPGPGEPGRPAAGGWRAICRSLWHGPDRDGKFEVEMLTASPPGNIRSQAVYALRGPDVQSEVQIVQLLGSIGPTNNTNVPSSLPLLRHLMSVHAPDAQLNLLAADSATAHGGGGGTVFKGFKRPRIQGKAAEAAVPAEAFGDGEAGKDDPDHRDGSPSEEPSLAAGRGFNPAAIAMEHIARFNLNADQAAVLMHCASWFKAHQVADAPKAATATTAAALATGGGGISQSERCQSRSQAAAAGRRIKTTTWMTDANAVNSPSLAAEDEEEAKDRQEDDDDFVAFKACPKRGCAAPEIGDTAPRRHGKRRHFVVDESQEEEEQQQQNEEREEGGLETEVCPIVGGAVGPKGGGEEFPAAGSPGNGIAVPSPPHPSSMECQPPVCLVHGPFGSGKSSLLVALILMLIELGREPQRLAAAPARISGGGRRKGHKTTGGTTKTGAGAAPLVRVLLASHTNVAVDRVLIGLQDAGFTDFLRLGSVDRIARPVLHRSLRAGDDGNRDTAAELRKALKESSSPTDVAYIEAELTALAAGAEAQRRKALRTCPVVGATICSLLQPAAEDGCGGTFTVVVLDECSQMTEPLCLVPLLRAKARFLVAAGDPLQLPPVIANPANLTHGAQVPPLPHPASLATHGPQLAPVTEMAGPLDSLLRPMFVRLSQLGHRPHLLSYQYRCHPLLSGIANAAFYGGRLRDGCSASDREPLLLGLPTLAFVEVQGQAQVDGASRSSYNMTEAQVVARAVARMLECGVDPETVGVICFYRAQVNAIRRALQTQVSEAASAPASSAPSATPAGQSYLPPSGDGAPRREPGAPVAAAAASAPAAPRGRHGGVQVATVDSFQGAEKEIIFLATTVSRAADFAADAKRLNVALTRGRRHLLVVGAPSALSQTSAVFKEIIRTCQEAMRDSQQQQQQQQKQQQQQQQQIQQSHAGAKGATAGRCHALYVSAAGLHRLLASLDVPACEPQSPHPARHNATRAPRGSGSEMLPPPLPQ
ncbi:hypothetical protein VaNZ11_002613, partial [Volvox africanus]